MLKKRKAGMARSKHNKGYQPKHLKGSVIAPLDTFDGRPPEKVAAKMMVEGVAAEESKHIEEQEQDAFACNTARDTPQGGTRRFSRAGVQKTDKGTSVARNTALMSACTLLSRGTGFFRTWACAFALGNTLLTSAYQVANNMPNMLYELVAGGLISTAFLPVFLSLYKSSKKDANCFAANLLNICILILGVIALLATFFAPQVMMTQTFMTGGTDEQLATFFFRFFAIQVVFYGAGGIISGILNAERRFLWPALGPVFNNIVVIATMFAYVPVSAQNEQAGMTLLAIGTSLGVLAMFTVQLPALMRSGFKWRLRIDFRDPALKEAVGLAIPAFIFTAMNLVCVSVRNAFALDVSPAGPSTLSYAWLWYQLPYGVLGVALSTAMFTEMSESAAKKDLDAFRDNVKTGLRGTFFLIIPMAVMLLVLSPLLVALYHAGAFTADNIAMVAQVLSFWAVCLPFYAGYLYLYFTYSSLKKLKVITVVNLIVSCLQIALYAFLTKYVAGTGLGLIGIPIADTVFFGLMFAILLALLHQHIGSFGAGEVFGVIAKVSAAAVCGGGIAYLVRWLIGTATTIPAALGEILLAGGLGLVVTYGICALMKVPEMDLLKRLGRKIIRKLSR